MRDGCGRYSSAMRVNMLKTPASKKRGWVLVVSVFCGSRRVLHHKPARSLGYKKIEINRNAR